MRPEWFNLNNAYNLINDETKYAWGTGGIKNIPGLAVIESG